MEDIVHESNIEMVLMVFPNVDSPKMIFSGDFSQMVSRIQLFALS
jgi:hypothetical protein